MRNIYSLINVIPENVDNDSENDNEIIFIAK